MLVFRAASIHAGNEISTSTLGKEVTLSQIQGIVLADNPSIKSAVKKWNAMKARIPQAAAWDDPKVSYMGKLDRYVSAAPNSFPDQILSVEQMLPISGKNRARTRAVAAEAVAAYEQMRRLELDVVAKTRASYFRLANVYAQLELNRKNLVSLKQIAEISRAKYETGDESASFVLTAETEYSKLMETRRDLEQQLAAEESQLNVLMNRDAFALIGRPEEAEVQPVIPPIEQLRDLTFAHRPEVRIAAAGVEQKKAILQLAQREWIPDPAITVQAQRYNGASHDVSEVDAGISFNVPWVNFHKYSAEIQEAKDNLDAAQEDLQGARAEAIGALRDALQKVETMHHHLQLLGGKLLPQARQAFEASQLSYENGKASFPDWITAQRNIREIESAQRQDLSDYQAAVAELEAVVGSDLTTLSNKPTSK